AVVLLYFVNDPIAMLTRSILQRGIDTGHSAKWSAPWPLI
ncbi:MAG: hypothetical protein ACI9C3_002861, partial [Yoonia sp.]